MKNRTSDPGTSGKNHPILDTEQDIIHLVASFTDGHRASEYIAEMHFLLNQHYSFEYDQQMRYADSGMPMTLDTPRVCRTVHKVTSLHTFLVRLFEIWDRHKHLHPTEAFNATLRE